MSKVHLKAIVQLEDGRFIEEALRRQHKTLSILKHRDYSEQVSLFHFKVDGTKHYHIIDEKKQNTIYFLYNKGKIVYVGKSSASPDICDRPQQHLNDPDYPKVFDSFTVMVLPEDIDLQVAEMFFFNGLTDQGGELIYNIQVPMAWVRWRKLLRNWNAFINHHPKFIV